MKKSILSLVAICFAIGLFAQEEMSLVWEGKAEHSITRTGTGLEGEISYVANDKEITVFKNDDGSVVWSNKFKELAPNLRKIDELEPFWDSEVIFLFDRKVGKDQIACINLSDGKLLWTTDKYQNVYDESLLYVEEKDAFAITLKDGLVFVNAKTGEELWRTAHFKGAVGKYIYNGADETITMMNFQASGLAALFTGMKNQIMRLDINTGEVIWQQTYIGRAQRKVISREFLFDLQLSEDKVVLRLNGIQVYDYKTGTPLWSAAFNFTADKVAKKPGGVGKVTKFGVYGAVADPVEDGNFFYVLDMSSKKSQYVKKYDKNTGKLIWTSPEIKGGARAIPNMYVADGTVVLQIGGAVEVQYHAVKTTTTSSGTTTETVTAITTQMVKPMGVQAFDAQNGAFKWESERFKKGITNMVYHNGDILVCSGKAYYGMEANSGKEKFEVNVKDDGNGLATRIFEHNGKLVVVGEKGISLYSLEEGGKLIKANKYKKSDLEQIEGDIMIMKTAKADIAAFDLNDASFTEFKARKGATTFLSRTADYVYIYEKKKMKKVKTKG